MNNMRNGMIILEQTDTNQQAVFIDEEHLDWLRLNAMFKQRDKERSVVRRKNRIKENNKRKWNRYTVDTFTFIGIRVMLMVAAVWTMVANLVNPIIAVLVLLYAVSTACIRYGVWYGKYVNHKS